MSNKTKNSPGSIFRKSFAAALPAILVVFLFCFGCNENKLKNYQGLKYDEIDGATVNLEDCFGKKTTLVLNYCTWDPVSLQQLQSLSEIHKKYGNSGLGIIVFVYDDTDLMRIQHFKKSNNCKFPFFLGDSRSIKIFGDEEIVPGMIIFDNQMTVQKKINGYMDTDNLSTVLKNYLNISEF